MFGRVRNKLQAKGLILFPILKLSRENTHLENVCGRFLKRQNSLWESKQNKCLCRTSHLKGSLKKCHETFRRIHKKTYMLESLFGHVYLCKFAASLKRGLFLWILRNLLENLFCRTPPRRVLLINAVSIVVKGELASKTVNYGKKTRAYVL